MAISNYSIMTRIVACFVALGATVGGAVWYATSRMVEIDARYSLLLASDAAALTSLARAEGRIYNFGRIAWRITASSDAQIIGALSKEATDNQADFHGFLDSAKKGVPMFAGRIDALSRIKAESFALLPTIAKASIDRNTDAAVAASRQLVEKNGRLRDEMRKLMDEVDASVHKASDAATVETFGTIRLTITGILLAFAAVLAAAFAVVKLSVSKPLNILAGSMNRLATGDLATEVPGAERADEVGTMAKAVLVFKENGLKARAAEAEAAALREANERERAAAEEQRAATAREQADIVDRLGDGLSRLAARDLTVALSNFPADYRKLEDDFNRAVGALRETMEVVASNAGTILSGSSEISSAADDLSKRTEQQAASLEETAAALDEITATGKKAAEGAGHAREVVALAQSDAEQTGRVVDRTVAAMGNIEKSAQQINQIISVIDEIAFQTNLLALNAGVEAARAGEAGRGFAVVASEVRALAQRSAEAAKEIKSLISTSTSQVSEGVELVAETGKALRRILDQVNDINKVIVDIASGAQEQATGLAQVNTAINQMDQATQQNASMVEQSTAASHSLAQEANALSGLIAQFNIGPKTSHGGRASATPSRPQLKTVSRGAGGSAAVKAAPQASAGEWEDF